MIYLTKWTKELNIGELEGIGKLDIGNLDLIIGKTALKKIDFLLQ
jgi:hypothetical protein